MAKQKKIKTEKTPVNSKKTIAINKSSSPVCYANTDEVRDEYKDQG